MGPYQSMISLRFLDKCDFYEGKREFYTSKKFIINYKKEGIKFYGKRGKKNDCEQ